MEIGFIDLLAAVFLGCTLAIAFSYSFIKWDIATKNGDDSAVPMRAVLYVLLCTFAAAAFTYFRLPELLPL